MRPAAILFTFLAILPTLGRPARAAERVARFVVLTPEVIGRLPAPVRMNLRSVVQLGSGPRATGFLVDGLQGVQARGWVLTNQHVDLASRPGEPVTFFDGSRGEVLSTAVAPILRDYRLLEIAMPARSNALAVPLRRGRVLIQEPIYALSAAADPFELAKDWSSVLRMKPLDEAFLSQASASHSGLWTIQFSSEAGAGNLWGIKARDREVLSLKFTLPNAFGTSGSPIFSRPWHDVVALHWGGEATPPHWRSSAVAAHDILTDLEERRRWGELEGPAAEAVDRIQARATGLPLGVR